jgi:hypothetical protein
LRELIPLNSAQAVHLPKYDVAPAMGRAHEKAPQCGALSLRLAVDQTQAAFIARGLVTLPSYVIQLSVLKSYSLQSRAVCTYQLQEKG